VFISNLIFSADEFTFKKHTLGNNGTPMLLTNSYSRHDPLDSRTLAAAAADGGNNQRADPNTAPDYHDFQLQQSN